MGPQAIGGLARAASLTPQRRSEIAQKGAEARWKRPAPKREPDWIINVFMDRFGRQEMGTPWRSKFEADVALKGVYLWPGECVPCRLRVYLKSPSPLTGS